MSQTPARPPASGRFRVTMTDGAPCLVLQALPSYWRGHDRRRRCSWWWGARVAVR